MKCCCDLDDKLFESHCGNMEWCCALLQSRSNPKLPLKYGADGISSVLRDLWQMRRLQTGASKTMDNPYGARGTTS